jgi:hypothetical protein
MFLHEHAPDRLLLEAPLRAIVIPRVVDAAASSLHRVAPMAALKALAPTTMFQLPGSAGEAMVLLARLVKTLPCYRLDAGSEIAASPKLLRELLADLGGAESARKARAAGV